MGKVSCSDDLYVKEYRVQGMTKYKNVIYNNYLYIRGQLVNYKNHPERVLTMLYDWQDDDNCNGVHTLDMLRGKKYSSRDDVFEILKSLELSNDPVAVSLIFAWHLIYNDTTLRFECALDNDDFSTGFVRFVFKRWLTSKSLIKDWFRVTEYPTHINVTCRCHKWDKKILCKGKDR